MSQENMLKGPKNIEIKLLLKKSYWAVLGGIFFTVLLLYILSYFVSYNAHVQSRKDASGLEHAYASKFFYFYYYTGFFPLVTSDSNLGYSKRDAWKQIHHHGERLLMEYKHWSRLGEHARIFCYIPNAVLKGSAAQPSVRLFNALFFLLGLLCLYRGFYKVKKPLLGLILCILILATPYFQFEVFRNENIFALQASVFFLIFGLLLPFLFEEIKWQVKVLGGIIISSCIIAFCSEIRNEISVVLTCLLLMVWLSHQTSWKRRLLLSIVALIFFVVTKKGIQVYFDTSFAKTKELVSKYKGHVYTGPRIAGHRLWHPIFCGLGDYDTKYGYAWSDTVAYAYAVPLLNSKYHLGLHYSGNFFTDNYYDSAHQYYIKFDEIPAYESVVQEKVINDIRKDSFWYVGILLKRLVKICMTTLPIPFLGFVAIVALLLLIKKRNSLYLKMLVITLPLSATSFLIYSGKGATYNGMFGYFILAMILYQILFILSKKERLQT